MISEIEYKSRAEMVKALLEFRKDPEVESIEVVGSGRTLRITGAAVEQPVEGEKTPTPEPEGEKTPTPVEGEEPEPEGEKTPTPVEGEEPEPEIDPKFAEKIAGMTQHEIEDGLTDGSLDAEQVYAAEAVGRKRKGVLAVSGEGLIGDEDDTK